MEDRGARTTEVMFDLFTEAIRFREAEAISVCEADAVQKGPRRTSSSKPLTPKQQKVIKKNQKKLAKKIAKAKEGQSVKYCEWQAELDKRYYTFEWPANDPVLQQRVFPVLYNLLCSHRLLCEWRKEIDDFKKAHAEVRMHAHTHTRTDLTHPRPWYLRVTS
jgi:hypothetical protein